MIEVDIDALSKRIGGRFRLCSLVIKRARAKLLAQGGTGETLNSQVIRQILQEIDAGHLTLVEPAERSESSTEQAPPG